MPSLRRRGWEGGREGEEREGGRREKKGEQGERGKEEKKINFKNKYVFLCSL